MLGNILKARKENIFPQSGAIHQEQDMVLEVDNVSKKFSRTLKSSLRYGLKDIIHNVFGLSAHSNGLRPDEFWALKDVSLKLKKGESLGLLGLNGSGKSTLLKLINGTYLPDNGEIRLKGRLGALIELGAGFHPMFTGRENIYTKGALLGLSKEEIDAKYEDIVEFANIGEFIDSPVRTYSSGMYVRLGFAVTVHTDPDILLVDEVLAVGDFKFRQQCLDRINQMKQKMAVIFVSHSMRDISLFCDRAIVLSKGAVAYKGKPDDAIAFYLEKYENNTQKRNKCEATSDIERAKTFCGDLFHNQTKITGVKHHWVNDSGEVTETIKHGSKITLEFSFKLSYKPSNLVIGVPIWDSNGNYITATSTDMGEYEVRISDDGFAKGRLVIDRVIFNTGLYFPVFSIVDGNEFLYRQLISPFKVSEMVKKFGFVTIDSNWEFD